MYSRNRVAPPVATFVAARNFRYSDDPQTGSIRRANARQLSTLKMTCSGQFGSSIPKHPINKTFSADMIYKVYVIRTNGTICYLVEVDFKEASSEDVPNTGQESSGHQSQDSPCRWCDQLHEISQHYHPSNHLR